jgi:mono/diheme cytochrome c family protein
MKTFKILSIIGVISFALYSFTAVVQEEWKVPAKYETMKNPIPAKTDAAIGKALYSKHCKSCHGAEGYGDGTKAADMKGDLGDFSSAEFQKQSDGALFYKTTIGRDDMPEFTKKLPSDEDRWLVVNYMRTLKE